MAVRRVNVIIHPIVNKCDHWLYCLCWFHIVHDSLPQKIYNKNKTHDLIRLILFCILSYPIMNHIRESMQHHHSTLLISSHVHVQLRAAIHSSHRQAAEARRVQVWHTPGIYLRLHSSKPAEPPVSWTAIVWFAPCNCK